MDLNLLPSLPQTIVRLMRKPQAKEFKIALTTGRTGQNGSYLTEFLLEKGYEVCSLIK